MKIKELKIAGFRGFNEERVIDFHERLNVIAARNSHGKTSISEALEFLLYGVTSKVEKADSKEEYKDSIRNRHFPSDQAAYIEGKLLKSDGQSLNLRVEIGSGGTIRRALNGSVVDQWPFQEESLASAKPFVLQHALKYLLLVPPSERFQGFAQLLGLNKVEDVFRSIINLCTKPSTSVSEEGHRILNELDTMVEELASFPSLKKILNAFKKGRAGIEEGYKGIEKHANKLTGGLKEEDNLLEKLVEARTQLTKKVYAGDVNINSLTQPEAAQLSLSQEALVGTVNQQFLKDYGLLCIKGVGEKLRKEAKLLEIGVALLKEGPDTCPLCQKPLNEAETNSLHERHAGLCDVIKNEAVRDQAVPKLTQIIYEAKKNLIKHRELYIRPMSNLIASMNQDNEKKVEDLLGGPNSAAVGIVRNASREATTLRDQVKESGVKAELALDVCETSLKKGGAVLSDAEELGKALNDYFALTKEGLTNIKNIETGLAGPAKIFRHAIDNLAGAAEISVLVKFLENRLDIEKGLRIKDALGGLKNLKKSAEQTLAEIMEATMSSDLTGAVMKWYSKIKTVGDPEVHFSRFEMNRTKKGEFKGRQVSIKAKSYGVELASAVSSLSESKLNALGLCVSIASSIRKPGPWDFLVIDDPIQSWDEEHETQFIDLIRNLIEAEGKQLVVLSHKGNWAKQVCEGCRSLNGFRYEITGYTKKGPNIKQLDWSPLQHRLREAEMIANDPNATSDRLQQGEEELRFAICQLGSQMSRIKLGRTISPHKLNKIKVREIFVAAGVETTLVDRIQAIFVNVDNSHHDPKTYQPSAQRIRQALPTLRDILRIIETP